MRLGREEGRREREEMWRGLEERTRGREEERRRGRDEERRRGREGLLMQQGY